MDPLLASLPTWEDRECPKQPVVSQGKQDREKLTESKTAVINAGPEMLRASLLSILILCFAILKSFTDGK